MNANLMEKDIQRKAINAKRVAFQNEGNERDAHKETKRVETTGALLNAYIIFYYFLSLNGGQAKSQEIWPLRVFFTTLMILLFRRCQQSLSRVSSQNNGNSDSRN